ncbi:hypothetical protein JHW43_007650 [Diplocarpon mali]|nr:hypothetical protein JHW43_007650 [Diplocarpon mali]
MKFSHSILAAVGLVTSCLATLDPLTTITELEAYCKTVGPDTYVAVRYENVSQVITYDFNECYPYELPTGERAQVAVFCKTTTCNNNP